MAICKRCAINGQKVNGGNLGICKQHAKTRCQVCGNPSMGSQLCATHSHQEELARWLAESQFRIVNPDDEIDTAKLRREKLMGAKFMAHKAVEVFFASLLDVTDAIYGDPLEPEADEQRKAA